MGQLKTRIPGSITRAWSTFQRVQRLATAGNAHRIQSSGLRFVVETFREMKRNEAGLLPAAAAMASQTGLSTVAPANTRVRTGTGKKK